MKKKVVLILSTLMCISLCACGGSEPTSNSENKVVEQNDEKGEATENNSEVVENTEIVFSELEKNGNDIYCISKAQAVANMEKVVLTTENWSQYFENHDVVEKNQFGDVISERTVFSMKEGYIGFTKDGVSLKFKETKYREYPDSDEKIEYVEESVRSFSGSELRYDISYILGVGENAECIDAIGEMIVMKLPQELIDEGMFIIKVSENWQDNVVVKSFSGVKDEEYEKLLKYME